MMVLREEMYFEPRTISEGGSIRWYGERYMTPEMLKHAMETVYIRDSGKQLYVYKLNSDELYTGHEKIEAVFRLVCKVEKKNDKYCYGRKIV